MNKKQDLVSKYAVPFFLVLTYVLSWWSVPFAKGQIMPQGPAAAAILVLGLTAGRQGLSQLWRRMTNWRIPFVWLVGGPAIVVDYHLVAFVLNRLLGAPLMSLPHISPGTVLELLLLGGWLEEPGWSGYLLPKLRERFADHPNGLLLAALVTGVFRSIWHLPLFLYGYIPWFDIFVFSFAFQLLIAWVLYRSGGSVLAAMLLHLTSNLMGAFTFPMFAAADHITYTALFMGTACLVALIIVLSGRLSPGRAKEPIWQAVTH